MTTGDPIPEGSKSEVIDLSDPENVCEPLPNYPLGMASGFGGLGAKYLVFISSRSVKTRKLSFAQFVYFLRKVCIFFSF